MDRHLAESLGSIPSAKHKRLMSSGVATATSRMGLPIPAPASAPTDDGVPRRVPGSTAAFTLTQIRDLYIPPDWHSDDHAPMPGVVGRGRRPDMFACGYHRGRCEGRCRLLC